VTSSETPVDRVSRALREAGVDSPVLELHDSTRTALDAATTVGCSVGQIAKSLIFRSSSGQSILIIASGTNRVDERAVAAIVGEEVKRSTADFVRDTTGYAIGGVPPFAHRNHPKVVLVDADLMQYPEIWAAAGTPHAVVRLTPAQLITVCHGMVVNVKA
jgi:prolyl-tRNA editing enzyme YbaK/EbsC (Cys-tRNA(Pro) deacylase)